MSDDASPSWDVRAYLTDNDSRGAVEVDHMTASSLENIMTD